MKYLGLDISLTSTGVVCIESGKIISQKLVRPKMEGRKKAKEIRIIRDMIMLEILKHNKKNTKIMIEDFAYGVLYMKVNGKPICGSVFEMGGLGYAVQIKLLEYGYEYQLTEPTTLKKFVCGKGNAKKDIIIKEILKRWKEDFDSNDLADAYALARYAEEVMK